MPRALEILLLRLPPRVLRELFPPKCLPVAFSRSVSSSRTCSHTPLGSLQALSARKRRHTCVVIVKPGGTASPARDICCKLAPLPPRSSRVHQLASSAASAPARPLPKRQTSPLELLSLLNCWHCARLSRKTLRKGRAPKGRGDGDDGGSPRAFEAGEVAKVTLRWRHKRPKGKGDVLCFMLRCCKKALVRAPLYIYAH